jgi:ferredoxin
MRVHVNLDDCICAGMCTTYVPQLFRLSDEATHVTVVQEDVPEALEKAVEDAVACCPVEAISIA